MRKLRKCVSTQFATGVSNCPPDFGKMKGAILVEPGSKLPADLTADSLEELVHAASGERVYGIVTFVEYSKDGGEIQTSAEGYGPEQVTGVSARKDTFTLNKFYPELHSALTQSANKEWDTYFFDEDNVLYGITDGTDVLAGYPMASVYGDSTPFPTSSTQSQMTVTFAHADAKAAIIGFDYTQLDFNPQKVTLGLTQVELGKQDDGTYKLYEIVGGNDITSIYGPLIAAAGTTVLNGSPSAVEYNSDDDVLSITADDEVSLKSPALLYQNDIKGIEQA